MTDDLLVRYLLGEVSGQEKATVEAWMNADASNKAYFESFREIWNKSLALASATNPDENAAWLRFRSRLPQKQTRIHSRASFSWLKIAAVFILLAGIGLAGYFSFFNDKQPSILNVTALEKILTDTLPDGSAVTLNKNSTLSYPEKFAKTSRSVTLKGEAFFHVTPGKENPFIITVNDVTVKVVGTSFNIRSENGNTEVIVETGIVQVTRNGRTVELRPGEKTVAHVSDSVLVKEKEQDRLYNYYRTKEFTCENTPLWKLVQVLNEAYQTQIVIGNNSLRNLPLTTTFSNESLDHILEVIRMTFNIQIEKTGNRITLK
jgi:transmembrane sensor